MRDAEIVAYLANVFHVAHRDGRFASQELAALDEVRRRLSAKRAHMAEATKLAQAPGFTPAHVGLFGDQVRNLEDMVFVALADADLVAAEQEVISGFCRDLGLTQAQLDQIVTETQVRCSHLELRSYNEAGAGAGDAEAANAAEGDAGGGGEEPGPVRQSAIARRVCRSMLKECRAAGISQVELLPASGEADRCQMAVSMSGVPIGVDEVPELPLPACTARRCLCVWTAAG